MQSSTPLSLIKILKLLCTQESRYCLMTMSDGLRMEILQCLMLQWTLDYDGTEVCELVGLYLLHKLTSANPKGKICLYRGDV